MKSANPLPSARRVFALFLVLAPLPFPRLARATESTGTNAGKADTRIATLLSHLEKVRNIHQVALAPDSQKIAWVVDSLTGGTEIELASVTTPDAARQITTAAKPGSCEEEDIAWAPDGKQFAFLSNCNSPGQMQIFLISTGAPQSPRQVGELKGFAQSLQWSPDGKSLAFLYVEGATRRAGALDAMKSPSGVIGEDGVEIQRIAAVNAITGQLQPLTPASLHVYEFDWSPDSTSLAYVAAAPPGENNWWIAELYTQDIAEKPSGTAPEPPHVILDPSQANSPLHGLQIAVPRWSPDGKHIALIGGLMSDQGATGGDIYIAPVAGGDPRRLAIPSHASASTSWIYWKDPQTLGVSLVENGQSGFTYLHGITGQVDQNIGIQFRLPVTVEDGLLEGSQSFARNGDVAQIRSSWAQPPEVFLGKFGGDFRQITHYNDALKPPWGKAESISWTSDAATGKFDVQGWLLYPANYDPAKKYPMIVSVHGGPASAQLPVWPSPGFNAAAFSALDYFVFLPNPRGSYGQGEAFTMANRKDFGYGDLHDIVTGVDAVVARYPVDSTRVGLTGWSYGGFMTMFAVTQTQRFRAAVAGAGISNWQSYYGQNSIDQWMVPYFGASVYRDPAAYYKSSAINFIREVKTPTLVVVGDRDGECPAPQSFEFWHALRAQHVPTRLVVYPNEGHRFVSPEHRRDVLQRALEWFDHYMPPEAAAP